MKATVPLDSSFLKRCVPISCCSGEVEKIIWVISSVITLPFTEKDRESRQKQMMVVWFSAIKEDDRSRFCLLSPWAGPCCLPGTPGSRCRPSHHPPGYCHPPLLPRSSSWKAAETKSNKGQCAHGPRDVLIWWKRSQSTVVWSTFSKLFLPARPFSVCEAVALPLPFSSSFLLCSETCSCSSWAVHCPLPDSWCSLCESIQSLCGISIAKLLHTEHRCAGGRFIWLKRSHKLYSQPAFQQGPYARRQIKRFTPNETQEKRGHPRIAASWLASCLNNTYVIDCAYQKQHISN